MFKSLLMKMVDAAMLWYAGWLRSPRRCCWRARPPYWWLDLVFLHVCVSGRDAERVVPLLCAALHYCDACVLTVRLSLVLMVLLSMPSAGA